jgi:hypothetical protein
MVIGRGVTPNVMAFPLALTAAGEVIWLKPAVGDKGERDPVQMGIHQIMLGRMVSPNTLTLPKPLTNLKKVFRPA